jgi:hypothetical protein
MNNGRHSIVHNRVKITAEETSFISSRAIQGNHCSACQKEDFSSEVIGKTTDGEMEEHTSAKLYKRNVSSKDPKTKLINQIGEERAREAKYYTGYRIYDIQDRITRHAQYYISTPTIKEDRKSVYSSSSPPSLPLALSDWFP